MKIIIAGSRSLRFHNDYQFICEVIHDFLQRIGDTDGVEVVCGLARGADTLGKLWGDSRNLPVVTFPAKWDKFGKSAGYRRNVEMADYSDVCFVFWDGESKGSSHMMDIAKSKGIPLHIFNMGGGAKCLGSA